MGSCFMASGSPCTCIGLRTDDGAVAATQGAAGRRVGLSKGMGFTGSKAAGSKAGPPLGGRGGAGRSLVSGSYETGGAQAMGSCFVASGGPLTFMGSSSGKDTTPESAGTEGGFGGLSKGMGFTGSKAAGSKPGPPLGGRGGAGKLLPGLSTSFLVSSSI